MFKIKGAHAANAAMRARGIVPGSAGSAAWKRISAERRAAKEALKNGVTGVTLKEGTY